MFTFLTPFLPFFFFLLFYPTIYLFIKKKAETKKNSFFFFFYNIYIKLNQFVTFIDYQDKLLFMAETTTTTIKS